MREGKIKGKQQLKGAQRSSQDMENRLKSYRLYKGLPTFCWSLLWLWHCLPINRRIAVSVRADTQKHT